MTQDLTIEKVRANFPSLSQEQVYFDNAGGTQVLVDVISSYVLLLLEPLIVSGQFSFIPQLDDANKAFVSGSTPI